MKTGNGFVLRILCGHAFLVLLAIQGCATGALIETNQTHSPASSSTPTLVSVSGSVSGLSGAGLVLQNSGGSNLQVNAAANSFTFANAIASGSIYDVTVFAQPANPSQTCIVTNASGTASASVTDVQISCTTNTYSVSGSVSGLSGSGLVLQNSGGSNLQVNAAANSFTFANAIISGSSYNVTVLTQPANPSQRCIVTNASGTASANVTNVQISCTTNTYSISGSVSGLSGAGLVLQNSGGSNLQVNAAANSFTFANAIISGSSYNVTVLTQPANPSQTCTVTNASGTASANVTDVQISCTTNTYSISGTVSGLSGTGLVLQNDGGNNFSVGSGATSFAFSGAILSGGAYDVSVLSQPSSPSQTCTRSNATGQVTNANVTNVQISCTTNVYAIGGTVSGLTGTGLVLQDNGGNNLTLSTGATNLTFGTHIASGGTYNVTVFSQPSLPSQTCVVTNAGGPVTNADIANVQVTCTSTFVYVSNERANTIYAYSVATNGNLAQLSTSPFVTGSSPEGLAVDPTGKFLYVANVLSNNVSAYSIASDGSLAAIVGSPFSAASGAISVAIDPTGKFLYVPSCGADCSGTGLGSIAAFTISPQSGALTPISGSPFTADRFPYEMAFFTPTGTPSSGPFAYVTNLGSNDISGYLISATGALSAISGSPFAAGTSPLALTVDSDPAFPRVFAANTGSNNLSIYAIQADGSLLLISGSPIASGGFTGSVTEDANQHLYVSGGAGVYVYSTTTALPSLIAGSPFAAGTGPNQLRIDPSGQFIYVVNAGSNNVSGYSINATSGVLSPLQGSPFGAGNFPHYIAFATR